MENKPEWEAAMKALEAMKSKEEKKPPKQSFNYTEGVATAPPIMFPMMMYPGAFGMTPFATTAGDTKPLSLYTDTKGLPQVSTIQETNADSNDYGSSISKFNINMLKASVKFQTTLNDVRQRNDVNNYPPSLRAYVNKCLTTLKDTDLLNKVKEIIAKAFQDGTVWTKDWSKEPIPSKNPIGKQFPGPGQFGGRYTRAGKHLPEYKARFNRAFTADDEDEMSEKAKLKKNLYLPPRGPDRYRDKHRTDYDRKDGKGHRKSSDRSNNKRNAHRHSPSPNVKQSISRSGSSFSASSTYSNRSGSAASKSISRSNSRSPVINNKRRNRLASPHHKGKAYRWDYSNGTPPGNIDKKPNFPKKNRKLQKINKLGLEINTESLSSTLISTLTNNLAEARKDGLTSREAFKLQGQISSNKELLEKRSNRFKLNEEQELIARKNVDDPFLSKFGLQEDSLDSSIDWTKIHVIGTSTNIERPYLRLTSAPDPEIIRPAVILYKSLLHVQNKWCTEHNYHYACEQLKSIRQDLMVQNIRDSLTVAVYETHCRIALEMADREEFNQCQTQLQALYDEGQPSKFKEEFIAYYIIYHMFTNSSNDLNNTLGNLDIAIKNHPMIKFVVHLYCAWSQGNYHKFFNLYSKGALRMSAYLIDWFIVRERKLALEKIIKAYKQSKIDLSFLVSELAFPDIHTCKEFIKSLNFKLTPADEQDELFDCKTNVNFIK